VGQSDIYVIQRNVSRRRVYIFVAAATKSDRYIG